MARGQGSTPAHRACCARITYADWFALRPGDPVTMRDGSGLHTGSKVRIGRAQKRKRNIMLKFGASLVLAMTTSLGGTAWGQETISGTLGDFANYFTQIGSDAPTGTGVVFRIRVLTPRAVGVRFETPISFLDQFQAIRTDADLTQPVPTGAFVIAGSTYVGIGAYNLPNTSVDAEIFTSAGEEISLVFSCFGNCDSEFTFSFILSGATLIILGPDAAEELAGLISASGSALRHVVESAQKVARDRGKGSLDARGGVDVGAKNGDALILSSKSADPGLVGNVYSWIEITGFDTQADTGPGSVSGVGFQLGADVAVGSDMVAGLSFGRSEISATDADFSQDGTLTYLQPYFAYGSGTWHGTASLIFGRGDYDQTSAGGDGSGESELFAITFEGGRDFALGERAMITPTLGLIHGREEVTGISGTLAGAGTESYEFNQVSLGARITVQGTSGQYFLGVFTDHLDQDAGTTVLADDFLSENGWSGRV